MVKNIAIRSLRFFLILAIFYVINHSEGRAGYQDQDNPKSPLEITTIKIFPYGDRLVGVKIIIKNQSDRYIHNSQVTCYLKDANNKIISFKKHYVIKSADGGLKPKGRTNFEYVIDASFNKVKNVEYEINSIRFR